MNFQFIREIDLENIQVVVRTTSDSTYIGCAEKEELYSLLSTLEIMDIPHSLNFCVSCGKISEIILSI